MCRSEGPVFAFAEEYTRHWKTAHLRKTRISQIECTLYDLRKPLTIRPLTGMLICATD